MDVANPNDIERIVRAVLQSMNKGGPAAPVRQAAKRAAGVFEQLDDAADVPTFRPWRLEHGQREREHDEGGERRDGQVLVLHDMLGLSLTGRVPKFVKNFMAGQDSIHAALSAYVAEVKGVTFPGAEHGFSA